MESKLDKPLSALIGTVAALLEDEAPVPATIPLPKLLTITGGSHGRLINVLWGGREYELSWHIAGQYRELRMEILPKRDVLLGTQLPPGMSPIVPGLLFANYEFHGERADFPFPTEPDVLLRLAENLLMAVDEAVDRLVLDHMASFKAAFQQRLALDWAEMT